MVIDVNKCTGCYSCFLACRDEFCGNDYAPYSAPQPFSGHFWMRVRQEERGQFPKVKVAYIPLPCQHCEDAPCQKAAPDQAIYRRPDGIVLIDPAKAAGQPAVVGACPYGAIYWNPELHLPQKCTFCAHLLDRGWKEPRCVEACPTGALVFGDLDEPLHPEYPTQPKVLYLGLPKRFIAGEVVLADQEEECAVGVKVTLVGEAAEQQKTTDNYGDFEFPGLSDAGEYTVNIEHVGYAPVELRVRTETDLNLGTIRLHRIPKNLEVP
jgi:Fe-S-cluster-containing dehydrogenase component